MAKKKQTKKSAQHKRSPSSLKGKGKAAGGGEGLEFRIDDLHKVLPRWAQVAFAARCARRVQPLFHVYSGDSNPYGSAVDSAIRDVEQAPQKRTDEDRSNAILSADVMASSVDDAVRSTPNRTASAAAQAAHHAAATLEKAYGRSSPSDCAIASANSAFLASQTINCDIYADIHRDFDHLVFLAAKEGWDNEIHIRPDVFGPMWPNGAPDGWPEVDPTTGRLIQAPEKNQGIDIRNRLEGLERRSNENEEEIDQRIKAVFTEQQATFAKRQGDLGRLQDELNQRLAEAQKILDGHRIESADIVSEITADRDSLKLFIKITSKELEGLKEKHKIDKASAAPIKYWEDRADRHSAQFLGWSIALGVVGFGAIALVLIALACGWVPDITIADSNPWRLGSMALIGTLFLLMLRVLTRIVMSNLHLATEARERVVMMQAYLALLDGKALDDNHRVLILQALFRPSTTGLVKDDAVPASMLDLATRVSGGKN